MNLTETDIDRIVAEVVRRLRTLLASSSTSGSTSRETTSGVSELKLSEKVITLQSLKGRLDGIEKVIVSDRAIVTPAVKDELKDRKIAWERCAPKVRS